MQFTRASGVLLHPTSLPGPYGIGDLGPTAYAWLDFLAETGCGLWQVLPLGPTGYGDSPYQCFSAFAGNPYLISPKLLLEQGWLAEEDLDDRPDFPTERVDYGTVIPWKLQLLDRAADRFEAGGTSEDRQAMEVFRTDQREWLEDFALFMALKEAHGGRPWLDWPLPLRRRQPAALVEARHQFAPSIQRQIYRQFVFFRQWEALRVYAAGKGVKIVGDVPIFVALDSADVWANPELFYLDQNRQPTVVAGVPPDYFSPTGQLWGNPLYRWKAHQQTGYAWWLARLRAMLAQFDILRLDHFRGFAGYWEVPADAPTAEHGRWVPGPGEAFFEAMRRELGDLPLIAEDLGEITPDVVALRQKFDLPGMKVLVFAFDSGPDNLFLPHHYEPDFVVYTGTHDNDTSLGWYRRAGEQERRFFHRYLQLGEGDDVPWALIQAAWSSVAVLALTPLQDLLGLGNEARMNFPGRPAGNWTWRMPDGALTPSLVSRLADLNYLYSR